MVKLVSKILLYFIISLVALEILVRAFHLYNDRPDRFVDKDSLNKWVPGQEGYSVYGNRRQVFAKYHINSLGYNSYREFEPSEDGVEVALIGDSFIEGFHQDYDDSIGKKVENILNGKVEVFEYGHSANDLADQLHTIQSYSEEFKAIDYIVISIRYEDDLTRGAYKPINRIPGYGFLKYSKLLVYVQDIGLMDPVKKMVAKISALKSGGKTKSDGAKDQNDMSGTYINNFKSLIDYYGLDKDRTAFLLDGSITDKRFLDYLKDENIDVIDYAQVFYNDDVPKTLIFDQHWNNKGRTLIADLIADYVSRKEENK
ncbi:SGNH/GDSL hydrolase family protein [Flagellimonas beolgyonensis]|uniref:SGNH/GDSL hydrolase family protein n=1 Tax=Flagellimonas beolgyonensis TaxID=864064 RepID=UPI003D654BEE